MRYSESLCRQAADALVEKLSEKGFIRLRTEKKEAAGKILAAFVENFGQKEELEKEATRLAEEHIKKAPGVDRHKVTQLIKQRLAEERRFPL